MLAPANSRIVTAPLIVEYGLTSRLTLGVVVPLVETRTTLVASSIRTVAVGGQRRTESGRTRQCDARRRKTPTSVDSLRRAAAALRTQARRSARRRRAAPGARRSSRSRPRRKALIQTSGALAGVLEKLYGTERGAPGSGLRSVGEQPDPTAINQQIQTLATQLQSLLGTNVHRRPR